MTRSASSEDEVTVARVAVVVVTFNPDGGVVDRLVAMRDQGGALIVVDNASERKTAEVLAAACADRNWIWVSSQENRGLGAALNRGIAVAAERGFPWVLLFDQDSHPVPDFCAALLATLQKHPEAGRVAVIGANIQEQVRGGKEHRWLCPHPWLPGAFSKVRLRGRDLTSVTMVITSGSLLRRDDFAVAGQFAEEFFIDYLDTDYCLRCRRIGRLIAVSQAAKLEHAFGDRASVEWMGQTFLPTNHQPIRHYYIARNRVLMIRRHAVRFPHWFFFDLAAAGLWLFRVLAFESRKTAKLRAMLLGTWDALRGRSGVCPPERASRF